MRSFCSDLPKPAVLKPLHWPYSTDRPTTSQSTYANSRSTYATSRPSYAISRPTSTTSRSKQAASRVTTTSPSWPYPASSINQIQDSLNQQISTAVKVKISFLLSFVKKLISYFLRYSSLITITVSDSIMY
jgi:hypothetical protein